MDWSSRRDKLLMRHSETDRLDLQRGPLMLLLSITSAQYDIT